MIRSGRQGVVSGMGWGTRKDLHALPWKGGVVR